MKYTMPAELKFGWDQHTPQDLDRYALFFTRTDNGEPAVATDPEHPAMPLMKDLEYMRELAAVCNSHEVTWGRDFSIRRITSMTIGTSSYESDGDRWSFNADAITFSTEAIAP